MLVGRNGHLGGVHTKLKVATLQVVRAQRFQVSVELRPRIAVRLGVPAEPATSVLIKKPFQRRFAEGLVADHAHLLDACRLALCHSEGQIDTVAFNRRYRGDHFSAIQALVDVLAFELLLSPIGQCLVIRAAFSEADVTHCLFERVFVKFARASEVHIGNGGAFFDHHHQYIAACLQTHILEQAQTKQRADCRCTFVVVVIVAYAQRHGGKYRPWLYALQTLDTDILDLEGLKRPSRVGGKNHGCNGRCGTHAQAIDVFFHE